MLQKVTGTMPSASSLALILLVGVLAYFVASTFFYGQGTVPLPSYKSGFTGGEGFTVPTPTMIPPPSTCLSEETSKMLATFSTRPSTTGEGDRDLLEFTQMLNKLSCFKKDLLSNTFTVSYTLRQPFVTAHDVEPISETTGRCFAKTIPPRDLDIAMDKWMVRGSLLIQRLCTSYSLKEAEASQLEKDFQSFTRDVYDVARDGCLQTSPLDVTKRGPRDPHPFAVASDSSLGEFTGYY
jgi:hypothetical protein